VNEILLRENIKALKVQERDKQELLEQTQRELCAYQDLLAAVEQFERVFHAKAEIRLTNDAENEVIS